MQTCKICFTSKLVTNLNDQLQLLSKIAETEPQSPYAAVISGFKIKLTHFIRNGPILVNYYFH